MLQWRPCLLARTPALQSTVIIGGAAKTLQQRLFKQRFFCKGLHMVSQPAVNKLSRRCRKPLS
ncbi:hypothetical protein RGUI_0240 [Rhodovulum sp. P5]|nr:hypothetical protein RGUI_0240 [Rhodovulum sp. P5]